MQTRFGLMKWVRGRLRTRPQAAAKMKLAIAGGAPAIKSPLPPMYPGGMRMNAEEEAAVLQVLRSKRLFRYYGPGSGRSKVAEFERAFAAQIGTAHAVGVNSGSAALVCGLSALAIGPGDEVIVPAYAWITLPAAVMAVGAVPIVAEIDSSLTLDVADVARKITSRTKAIVPVHMRGAPSRMDAIMELARRHGTKVMEDAAQAIGGSFGGQSLGSIGDTGAFSFQFNKIITCGEGGIVVAKDEDIFERAAMYHDTGGGLRSKVSEEKMLVGLNFRMSELHGALMLVQLKRLQGLLADMRQRKAELKRAIEPMATRKGVSFRMVNDERGDTGIALIFFAPTAERASRIVQALKAEGANAYAIYDPVRIDRHVYSYWTPVLEKRCWSESGGPWQWHDGPLDYSQDMCAGSLELLGRAVHLDVSPDMSHAQVEELAEAINKVLDELL
jgi:8-amino-3,8-dideoxy-alpha-D-manno-octulosonate transaminase